MLDESDFPYQSNGKEYARQHSWGWYVDEIMMLYNRALAKNGTDRKQTMRQEMMEGHVGSSRRITGA